MPRRLETVAVVGGGPAGSSAALTLASAGVSTVLVQKRVDDEWKVGESLPPSAKASLQSLGVWDLFLAHAHREAYANRSAWGAAEPAEHLFLFDPYGPGWHLDRSRFDRMLRDAARRTGAAVWADHRVAAANTASGVWDLTVEGPKEVRRLTADVVVDATGRASWLARQQGARRRSYDRLVGMAARLDAEGAGSPRPDAVTLVEATKGGWWYSAPVPAPGVSGAALVAVYFTDADLVPAGGRESGWSSLLAETSHTYRRLQGFRLRSEPRIASAASALLQPVAGDTWVAVGDAATTFDPLSSQGICRAVESGRSAAHAVLRRLGGDHDGLAHYAAGVRRTYARYLAERAGYYALERRWPESAFWQRRSPVSTPQGGTHERHARLLRHPPGHRAGPGREQPDRVLHRARGARPGP